MKYKYYEDRPERLTAEFLSDEYARLEERVEEAEKSDTPELWMRLFRDWEALRGYRSGEGSRVNYAFAREMSNPVLEKEQRYHRTEITRVSSEKFSRLVRAFLDSRHRRAFAERYGEYFILAQEYSLISNNPVNTDLRVRAAELAIDYSKTVASGEVTVNGESMTLNMASGFFIADDAELRREAYEAVRKWYTEHHDEFSAIFDEQVKLRNQMGLNLGHENFVPLAYIDMGRTDYGPQEAALFRENVRRYVVPLQAKIMQRQARELGQEILRPWDANYDPELTLPRGIVPVDTQLDSAGRLFNALSPKLAGYFSRMRSENLIDLENRLGKRSGAFCTYFADEGRPAIFCNSIGDSGDVRTLIHEMGHAFQKWESSWVEVLDLIFPTADTAEIHSTGLEYLSLPYITEFFSEEHAAKFRSMLWKAKVAMICRTAACDEFQHWVYENPNATPQERDDAWGRIAEVYLPGIDYSGIEQHRSTGWATVQHFFQTPFYTIDYAIAATAAVQLTLIDDEDHERAMAIYLELCRLGGTRSLLNVLKDTGLRSPFDPDLLRDLMAHAARKLEIGD